MTLPDSELSAALRAGAMAHLPDREAMLDRITQTAMRSHLARGKPAPRARIAGAAVAVAAVLGGGGFAQWALAGDAEPQPAPTVTVPGPPAPSTTPSATSPTPTPTTPTPTTPPSSGPAGTPISKRPPKPPPRTSAEAADPAAQGPIRSAGSVAPDGKTQGSSVVTIRTTERLTALDVTIRVARTPGLVSRGGSRQVPGASVTSTVTEEPGVLVYRFVLSSGDTVEPGTYTFSARYMFAEGGRDAGADAYRAVAVPAGAAPLTVNGTFR